MWAFKWLDARVLPHVSRQLVGAGELPVAAFPRALVRLFARVRSLVGLEVGALGVHLVAAWIAAAMDSLVALRGLEVPTVKLVRGVGRKRHLLEQGRRVDDLFLHWRRWVRARRSERVRVVTQRRGRGIYGAGRGVSARSGGNVDSGGTVRRTVGGEMRRQRLFNR